MIKSPKTAEKAYNNIAWVRILHYIYTSTFVRKKKNWHLSRNKTKAVTDLRFHMSDRYTYNY